MIIYKMSQEICQVFYAAIFKTAFPYALKYSGYDISIFRLREFGFAHMRILPVRYTVVNRI